MFSSDVRYQWLAAFCMNILQLSSGTVIGWTSAGVLVLKSKQTPLPSGPLTIEQISWVGSLLAVGSLFGTIAFGWMSNRFGRKSLLIAAAIPQLIGWLLIIFAQNPMYLYVSRFLSGAAGGGVCVIVPVYVAEISDKRIRGSLGSMFMVSCNIGMLISFIMGYCLTSTMIPKILITFPIIFLIAIPFFPESPQFLMLKDKEEKAKKAICFYRNIDWHYKEEFSLLKAEMDKLKDSLHTNQQLDANEPLKKITWRDFTAPVARKAIFIGITLLAIKKFCGVFTMIMYAGHIFSEAGSNLDPNLCAIIVGCIQLAGTYVPMFLVDRAGRKILLTFSLAGICIGLVAMGSYMYLKSIGSNLDGFNWIPLACFSFALFMGCCGMIPLPYVIISEIMPPEIRSFGSSMCMGAFWIFTFAMNKCFPILSLSFGMHVCFFVFAGVSFFGALLVIFMVPETKGKSFDEIMKIMMGS